MAMQASAQDDIKAAASKIQGHAAGHVGFRTIVIGLQRGLFAELAQSPGMTPEELGRATGLDPFYIDVWCRAAFGAEVLDQDQDGGYRLAPHVATILLDQESPAYGAGLLLVLSSPEVFDDFDRNLESGERTWWDRCGPGFIDAVSRSGRGFYNRLVPGGLDRVPGLREALDGAPRILELACGSGRGLAKLAAAFPSATFVGVDGDAYSLDLARRHLEESGVTERVELVPSTLENFQANGGFDACLINISMHEARDIERVAANAHDALNPGGYFVVSDFPFPETQEGLRTVPGRVMEGIQFFEALIDDQLLPTKAFVELLERHGFVDVGAFDINSMHAVTHGRRRD